MRAPLTLLPLLLACSAFAADLRRGELLVATHHTIDRHDPRGRFIESIPRGQESGQLIVEGSTRLVANRERSAPLRRINADGTLGEPFGPELDRPSGLAVDREGNAYTLAGATLVKLDPSGRELRRMPFSGHEAFDLARDQCTLYHVRSERHSYAGGHRYESRNFVSRFDVCRGEPRGDVVALGPELPLELRVVRNGLLLAFPDQETLLHIDFRGRVITRYSGQRFFRIALEPSGWTFWSGQGTSMRRYRLGSPQAIGQATTGDGHMIHFLAVVDGWRAAAATSRRAGCCASRHE